MKYQYLKIILINKNITFNNKDLLKLTSTTKVLFFLATPYECSEEQPPCFFLQSQCHFVIHCFHIKT